ncbi:MAG: CHASE3 domain-containing protein [Candidatus Eisenbacteria bacterium]
MTSPLRSGEGGGSQRSRWARGAYGTPTLYRINFAVLAVLLLINGAYSYQANRELIRNESRVQNTQSVLAAIKDTFSSLQDAETGQRGYVITGGDPEYLEPYDSAVQEIRSRRDELRTLDSELDDQRVSIEEFGDLIDQKMEELKEVVGLVDQNRDEAALRLIETDRGNRLMARIRDLVVVMEAREYALMAEQRAQSRRSREQVLRSIHIATLAGLLFLTAAFYLVQRAIRTERESVEKLVLTNEELEAMIDDRTIALERYSKELQRSNRELQDFAFVASHDLQEPLRKIRAFGDRLKIKYADQLGDGADYVNRMQAAAERMSRLINDLLAFSRVTTRAQPFEDTSLQEAFDEVLEDLGERIAETGAKVRATPLPRIEADPTQMRQLLQNLIGNALKFTAPGTSPEVEITSTMSAREDDPSDRIWYTIAVRDNGIGFDEQFAEKIFIPFQRLHNRESYSGTGIGLAVCRRVVERHGGHIEVSSQPGVGTTFLVHVPSTQHPIPLEVNGQS